MKKIILLFIAGSLLSLYTKAQSSVPAGELIGRSPAVHTIPAGITDPDANNTEHDAVPEFSWIDFVPARVVADYSVQASIPGTGERNGLTKVLPFPNPSAGVFRFSLFAQAYIEVYNATGIVVFKDTQNKGPAVVDLGNQPIGYYFMKLVSADHQLVEDHTLVRY